jgi:glycolate oxidase FAD binding subunit
MTSIAAVRKQLAGLIGEPIPSAPDAEVTVAPSSAEGIARVLEIATEQHLPVLVWGGGTHQGYGTTGAPAIVVSTRNLGGIDWRPDDLTVTVGAGIQVADLEGRLAQGGQTAVLPEDPGEATIGGVVAAGVSGYRRLRYGPTRDRVIGATIVTGDGRIVHGRGKVVKNVAGYDLPRLATGSFGRLGVITEISLKLWPVPPASATISVDSPEHTRYYRPLAVLEADREGTVVLGGHPGAVEADAGAHEPGARWPRRLQTSSLFELRVPARLTREAVERVPTRWSYRAEFGVGRVTVGDDGPDMATLVELRRWAESVGGSLVVAAGCDGIDPWGTPPATLDIQRRIVDALDPAGIMNPGRLPGGI